MAIPSESRWLGPSQTIHQIAWEEAVEKPRNWDVIDTVTRKQSVVYNLYYKYANLKVSAPVGKKSQSTTWFAVA